MSEIKSALELIREIFANYGIPTGILIIGIVVLIIAANKTREKIEKEREELRNEKRKQEERDIELKAREAAITKKEAYIESLEKELQYHRRRKHFNDTPKQSDTVTEFLS